MAKNVIRQKRLISDKLTDERKFCHISVVSPIKNVDFEINASREDRSNSREGVTRGARHRIRRSALCPSESFSNDVKATNVCAYIMRARVHICAR